ncbi:MAG: 3-phosphoserine/phosphohydroxythreonine transaminase [Candidatus Protistobacter heckmanni]|nr:3-phosphoserine/phosphohydroxythreonine transaminase [Candidatus Protistobacter heckmanni]
MKRVFNFSAGPAALPDEVLRTAAEEMLDWHGSGMGVMEMSHRGPEFISICDQAFADLRELLAVPADYDILFLQGGGIGENAIVPMNLIGRLAEQGRQPAADYVVSGSWSVKSFKEARKYGDIRVVASNEAEGFTAFPDPVGWKLNDDSAYVHVCTNETIHGIECHVSPEVGQKDGRVLVADVSSHILSRPMNISRFGAVYGGAQKNIGPAGVTIVIVRKDLLGHALPITPSAFDWKIVSEFGSMYNTPPTYTIYVAGLVFQWLKRQGGLAAIEQRNVAKAKLLYDFIDGSDFYLNKVEKGSRSRMNIPFFLADESRNKDFLDGAKARGMVQLKGHKSVGGMRASIYNAMPLEGVQALVDYMREFERKS